MLLILTSLLLVFTLLIYFCLKRNKEYWKNRNIPHPEPHLFFGNLKETLTMKKNLLQICTEVYHDFPQFPYVGIFKIRTPALLIREPKLVYDILTKDFPSFELNDMEIDEKVDPLAGKNPFFLNGLRWKTTRSQLTVAFTSGKIKLMLPLMIKVTEDMVKYIEDQMTSGFATLETKELAAKFTTDNVASCGFGLEAKSFSETEAEFRRIGEEIFQPGGMQAVKILLITLFPSLAKILRTKFVPEASEKYFRGVVKSTLIYREQNKIIRNDFLDNMNAVKEQHPNYTLEDVTSHALSFFLDGFETSSIGLSFAVYNLASNPLIQETARKEINETLSKHNNILTYECLQEMTYLDCVLSESLRLYPPGGLLLKKCSKDYYFPATNGNEHDLLVKKGTSIMIPIFDIQRDPKNFPNPEVFDPDRFLEANRSAIKKGTYLPFGDGPRICLGMKFARFQIKVALVALIKNFEMKVNKRTKEPLEMNEKYFMLSVKGGVWIDYCRRT